MKPSVILNQCFRHQIENIGFGNLPESILQETLRDGRAFSHFIEPWLALNYPITHIKGCKGYDFVDNQNKKILYDAKTFTKRGLRFCPSKMIGVGRQFNQEEFIKKSQGLIFCLVSNLYFPEIRVRFVRGADLIREYPSGIIPLKDHIKFFN